MSTAAAPAADPGAQLAGLGAHFDCFDVTLHMWSGRRQLRGAHVMLDGEQVDDAKVTTPQAILLPPTWQKRLSALRSARAHLITSNSLPHISPGLACVMRVHTPKFLTALDALQKRVDDTVSDLKSHWAEIVTWNESRWGDKFRDYTQADGTRVRGICHDLPDPTELHTRIKLTWSVLSITAGFEQIQDVENEELRQLMVATREMTRARVAQFVEEIVRTPRERIAAAVTDIQELLARGGNVTEASFNKLNTAIALARDFQSIPAMTDTRLMKTLRELQTTISRAPRLIGSKGETLRRLDLTAVGDALDAAFTQTLTECRNDEQVYEQISNLAEGGHRVWIFE